MTQNNPIINFEFTGRAVRVIDRGGEPWFITADVCAVLDISNSRDAVSRLDDDEKDVASTDTLGGIQSMGIINESGVYSLVFTSRKPEAKAFKKWVTSEVLPSIRQHGGYISGQESETDPAVIIARALRLADNVIAQKERELLAAHTALSDAKPKVDFYDAVAGSKTAIDIGSAAKILNMGIGRNRMFQFLREHGVLQPNNEPYQKHIDANHFRLVEQRFQKPSGEIVITKKTLVYQRGLDYIRKLLQREMEAV